ncbi:hypothetical protein BDZ89DRAFT_1063737 [Hymenopellis radicata]|nr:hypothetical protein BDZ89DRAFT_1063737 [Hymenopellis radicata]
METGRHHVEQITALSMLSVETPVSRPRPPAQMRRSHSAAAKTNSSPPPPYASAFAFPSQTKSRKSPMGTLLGSPVSATYQRIEREASSPRQSITSMDTDSMDWLNERSREELSSLLIRADGVIKQRESELDLASHVAQSLHEDNVSLKTKHSVLFARFPRSNAASPASSPAPMASNDSPQVYSSSLSNSLSRASSASALRHVRRVSIHPDDLNLLSDQNAELSQKVEKLEAESASAAASGRRQLKQLEKEIAVLREDLEKTQLKSQEYEEQAKRMKPLEAAWKRSKQRPSVGSTREEEEADEFAVKDFAPAGPLSRSPLKHIANSVSMPAALSTSDDEETTPQMVPQSVTLDFIPFPTADSEDGEANVDDDASRPVSQPELALISQLLSKIQELEETNAKIIERQTENSNKLMAVQRETEIMARVYESLNDPSMELIEEDPTAAPPVESGPETTVRFRSFRKTLEGGSKPPYLDDAFLSASAAHKARKSVVGLFDAPKQPSGVSRKSSKLSVPFETPTHRRTPSMDNADVMSPSLSSIHFSSSSACSTPGQELSDSPFHPGSLQNELGEDWSLNGSFHHLRNTSLYSLVSVPPSPSPQPSDPTPHSFRSLFASEMDAYQREHGYKTPLTKTTGLQLTIEPPTPEDTVEDASSAIGSPTASSPSLVNYERTRRMSQTIRARTNRWVNGRFTDSVLGPSVKRKAKPYIAEDPADEPPSARHGLKINIDALPENDGSEGSDSGNRTPRAKRKPKSLLAVFAQPVVPRRFSDALDSVVEKFQGHQRSASGSSSTQLKDEDPTEVPIADNAVEVFVDRSQVAEAQPQGLTKVMVEFWMWLQFGIIILVFLWAMARKGPKTVLETGPKRAVSRR